MIIINSHHSSVAYKIVHKFYLIPMQVLIRKKHSSKCASRSLQQFEVTLFETVVGKVDLNRICECFISIGCSFKRRKTKESRDGTTFVCTIQNRSFSGFTTGWGREKVEGNTTTAVTTFRRGRRNTTAAIESKSKI